MEKFIRDKMTDEQWPPKQIIGYCRLSGIAMVSHERICQFIRAEKENGGTLWLHTCHRLKHRKRPATGKTGNHQEQSLHRKTPRYCK